VLFVLLQVMALLTGLSFGTRTRVSLNDQIKSQIEQGIAQFTNGSAVSAFVLQSLQIKLQCCGWNGGWDYYEKPIPASCCQISRFTLAKPRKVCSYFKVQAEGFEHGCKYSPVLQQLMTKTLTLFGVVILLQIGAFLSALGMGFGLGPITYDLLSQELI